MQLIESDEGDKLKPLRVLADENIPGPVVRHLREAGLDVAWIQHHAPGASDDDVARIARQEGRVVLTYDRDFRERVVWRADPFPFGILLLRHGPKERPCSAEDIHAWLSIVEDWAHIFAYVDHRGRLRQRRLKPPDDSSMQTRP